MIYPHINKLPRLKLTKTYANGATHCILARLDTADGYKKQTDVEDATIGINGTWTEELFYVE